MKKMKLIPILLLLVISQIMLGAIPQKVYSQQTRVYVNPPEIRDLQPSQYFKIEVIIENVSNLYGIDIQFGWDPSVIEYVNHTAKVPVEDYPDGVLHEPVIFVHDDVNETGGLADQGAAPGTLYWLAAASMLPAEPFEGSGIAFEMWFHVVGVGSCILDITACMLADQSGNPIPCTVEDGYFGNYVPTPADIFIEPSTIVNPSLTPSSVFSVDIKLENIVDLYGFEFWLSYNESIIEVQNVSVNPIFPPPVEIVQYPGKLKVSASLTSSTSVTGNLTLATVEFHVLNVGATVLDLYNVTLWNIIGEPLPYNEPGDGYFNNILITRIFVNPPELIDPTLAPGDIFSIYVALENAIGISGYEFKLNYDNAVLTCLGAIIIPISNYTDFETQIQVNETEGTVFVKLQYYPIPLSTVIAVEEPQNVVEIWFQVENYGQTALDLFDADVYDQYGNSMSPVAEDGFFATLIRDVAIIAVNIISQNIVYPGRIVTINVVAMNRGNMTSETFNVTLYYDSNVIETRTVTLSPWTSMTLTFEWNTTGLEPCSNFTIWAEASQVPYESNLKNNVFVDGWVKIKMFGDVNGDGIIDILDIVAVTSIYGCTEDDPCWNPDADVAEPYGIIDILDVVTVSAKYGVTCS